MKRIIQFLLLLTIYLALSACTKQYDNVLKYFNESKIIKIEYVEYDKEDYSESSETIFEKYVSLELESLDTYIEEVNSLVCDAPIMKNYYWEGSGDIKYYYEDGSTLKWDGTSAKYIDKSGESKNKFFCNDQFWYLIYEYSNISLNLDLLIDIETFASSILDSDWITEDKLNTISLGEATNHIYGYKNDAKKIISESIEYENKTYITKRLEGSKINITEEAIGTFKYKNSIISVKFNLTNYYGRVIARMYFLENIDGSDKPKLNDDKSILECDIQYVDDKLILKSRSDYNDAFVDIFGEQEEVFNLVE